MTRAEIEACVPHAGAMCLLEGVARWDETHIVCEAAAPTADHPLALAQGVPAVAAIEYAAQAAAVHGALLDGSLEPRIGMLAKLDEIELDADWLDAGSSALTIEAELLVRGASGCMYSFMVHDERGCRVRGRLMVAYANEQ